MFEGRGRCTAGRVQQDGTGTVPGLLLPLNCCCIRKFSPEVPQWDGSMPGPLLGLKAPIPGRLQGESGIVRGRQEWEGMPHRGGAHSRSTGRRHRCGGARLAAAEILGSVLHALRVGRVQEDATSGDSNRIVPEVAGLLLHGTPDDALS